MDSNPFRIDSSVGSWANPKNQKLVETQVEMEEPSMDVQSVHGLLKTAMVQVRLADVQADPNSPLYSVKRFEDLGCPPEILKGIYAMKFDRPSRVQERALPLLLANPPQNLIAQSQSGTGKTATFVLTMLCRVDPSLQQIQALCLCPGRELARQIVEVVTRMAQFTIITIGTALKEESYDNSPCTSQILIGTPGTVLEMHRRRLVDLKHLKVLVFDEADVMWDKAGMGTQSQRLRNLCPENVQTLLFSATFKDQVETIAKRIVRNPNVLTIQKQELNVEGIQQFFINCGSRQRKLDVLLSLYELLTIGQSIIFVNSRAMADQIHARMQLEGHQVSNLHGGMSPSERDKIIDEFRNGMVKVLISTNVTSRGLDISQVTLVVNYDIPLDANNNPDPETYLHRIGRTGRFGRSGVSISLVHDSVSHQQLMEIVNYFGKPITEIGADDPENLEKSLKGLNK